MNKNLTFIFVSISSCVLLSLFTDPITPDNPSILSIVPPLIAIVSAFVIREVITSLFLGIWSGAWIINGQDFQALGTSLLDIPTKYALTAMNKSDNILIILITVFIGGMAAVISANGGMNGLVKWISQWATNRKKGQLSTTLVGFIIFFDDYTNLLITGNTMRPLTDKLRISREKLAYIVDSTSAPLAAISGISLWVGFQVALIKTSIETIPELENPFLLYLNSIAYSFYPILALIFVFLIIFLQKDFGPMLKAEQRALKTPIEPMSESNQKTASSLFAVIPISVFILSVLIGIYMTGEGNTVREILETANSFKALLIGCFLASITAITMSILGRLLTFKDAIESWSNGVNSVIGAVIILVLSWSLAQITQELQTSTYLVSTLGAVIPTVFFPAAVFIVAALIALGTGSAWGTMAILMPLVVPLCWSVIGGDVTQMSILYATLASVIAGAVWGDHCSPISDTTILASVACKCSHIEHVRTQMPYAILVAIVALIFCLIPVGFGVPQWLCLIFGVIVLFAVLTVIGKKSTEELLPDATKLQTER
jgi:Na+/H+ antiporter NhaC